MRKRVSKRTFLLGSIGALGALYVGAIGRGAMKTCSDIDIYPSYSGLEPFLRIGRTYLARAGDAERRDLAQAALAQATPADPAETFARDLEQRGGAIAADFDRDDVVVCEGWVLSRTEVALCATLAVRAG